MDDCLLNAGEAEKYKAAVHLGIFGLAVTCFSYSLMAWEQRQERHLLVNTLVYLMLSCYEAGQMNRHWQDSHHG